MNFRVSIEWDEAGVFVAGVSSLSGYASQGATCQGAIRIARLRLIVACASLVLLTSCIGSIQNLSPTGVTPGQKVLAGRILFFEEEKPVSCQQSDFFLQLKRDDDSKSGKLKPDADCYVYVLVPAGKQLLHAVAHKSVFTGTFLFRLNPLPVVEVAEDDSVVNFCTIEITFHQSRGSKAGTVVGGPGRAHIKVKARSDCADTRAYLEGKLAGAGPIRDSGVKWFNRRN